MQANTSAVHNAREETPISVDSSTGNQACFAIVWIRAMRDDDQARDLLHRVSRHDGVASARYGHEHPHIMVVDYDPERTRAGHILGLLTREGLTAQIVGC